MKIRRRRKQFHSGNEDDTVDVSEFAVPYVTYDAEGQTLMTSVAVRVGNEETDGE